MTPVIESKDHTTMLAVIGGICSVISFSAFLSQGNPLHLGLDVQTGKLLWGVASAGIMYAAIFNWSFEKWLWKMPLLQGWLVKVPVLTGTWTGPSESLYYKWNDGSNQDINVTVIIDHRFDRLIYKQRAISTNRSLSADLTVDHNDDFRLIVVYENEGTLLRGVPAVHARNVRPHRGCVALHLSKPNGERSSSSNWYLEGSYWTDKSREGKEDDRGTWGNIKLQWRSSSLKSD